ncbi:MULTISPECIES: YhcN/YlaJ family sporulation lipoprotein [Paenibacillus]|nr:YhcN/YlaJ family sporulation lipoprotein [Paenibacillus lactis]MCM3495582.1 YhcN/YlaJ family sporulation lipoprotein [Paenibacillus lactis]HAF99875.1 YhcN/YlaJ family sporulation lipoprotein [Paenibacillus lactis]
MKAALSLVLTMVLLAGCGTANNNASPSPRNQTNGQTNNTTAQSLNGNRGLATNNVDGWGPGITNRGDAADNTQGNARVDTSTANHLKALAESVPGVKNANCVVMGNTAVVGLNVDGNLDRAEVGTIKYTVAEALQKDPAGANALVTADLDITNRIADLGRHIQEGHPIAGLASELADIVGRIIPQLPKDVTPRNGNAQDHGGRTVQPNSPQGNAPQNTNRSR